MNHPDEETLLKYSLETLDAADASLVREHLSVCQVCRKQQTKIHAELERMSGVAINVDGAAPPMLQRKVRVLRAAARVAAVLVVGFLAGYMTAELSNPLHPMPVQQRLIPRSPASLPSEYVACQAVDARGGR